MIRKLLCIALLMWMPLANLVQAQSQDEIDELRQSLEVFNNTLKESLDLAARPGVFVPRTGDVRLRYLAGQGVVLEIISPLQNSRSPITAQAVNHSLQDLSAQLSSLINRGALMRPDLDAMRETMALSLRTDEIGEFYREQIQRLSSIDDFAVVDRALAGASAAVQRLHSQGELDASAMEPISERLLDLRGELVERLADMDGLRREMRERSQGADALPDDETRERWREAREQLQTQMAELRSAAQAQAEQLQARDEQLRARRDEQWRRDVLAFEARTFSVLCDYAGGLRMLPDDEHVTLVMNGLGEPDSAGHRRDRVYVVSKQDLLQCQRGDIDHERLRSRAVSYSF